MEKTHHVILEDGKDSGEGFDTEAEAEKRATELRAEGKSVSVGTVSDKDTCDAEGNPIV